MKREVHVRICGRLGARFPGPTREQETEPSQTGLRRRRENFVSATGRLKPLRLFSTLLLITLIMAATGAFIFSAWGGRYCGVCAASPTLLQGRLAPKLKATLASPSEPEP